MKKLLFTLVGLFTVLVLAACTTTATLKVKFDSQGGTSVPTVELKSGSKITMPANPTRNGFDFNGWATTEKGGTLFNVDTLITKEITLYAQWLSKKVTLKFDTQGGSEVASLEVDRNTAATKPADPTKQKFDFKGWVTEKDGTTEFDFTTKITEATTLFAKWEKSKVELTFDTNGGAPMEAQKVVIDEAATKPANPTIELGIFKGWFTEKDGTTEFDFATKITEATTIFAKWDKTKAAFSFDTLEGSEVLTQELVPGEKGQQPQQNPTREGFAFKGWVTEKYGTTNFDFNTPINKNTVVFASWEKLVTVSFDSQGGSEVQGLLVARRTAITKPADPTKEGQDFVGWFIDNTLKTEFNFAEGAPFSMTLFAKWLEKTPTVTFNTNEGSVVAPQTVTRGEVATLPTPAPTKEKHEFAGWFTSEKLEKKTEFKFTTKIEKSITLYAKWLETNPTLTFNVNGGSVVAAQTVARGTKPAAVQNPTKANYDFMGWYTKEDFSDEKPYDVETKLEASLTVYAKWLETNPTLTFNVNGGSAVAAQTVARGTKPAAVQDPTKADVVFAGWYTKEDFTGEPYNVETALEASLTVYAKWESPKTVKFELGEGVTGNKPADQTVAFNSLATKPAEDPTKDKHLFVGWFLEISEDEDPILFDFATMKVTTDITLKATFEKADKKVLFITLGGSTIEPQTVAKGQTVTEPTAPTRSGYEFKGWATREKTGFVTFEFTTAITKDTKLFAQWKGVPTVVTIDKQDGTETSTTTQNVEYSKLLVEPAAPTKANADFKGWFTTATGDEKVDFLQPITEEKTIYAQWSTEEKTFAFFNGDTKLTEVKKAAGQQLDASDLPASPSKAEFVFKGWFKTRRGLTWTDKVALDTTTQTLSQSQNFYAYFEPTNSKTHNWSENETYVTAMDQETSLVLNPTDFKWAHESSFMNTMATSLFASEVDWTKAIKDGVAKFPGDFSNIKTENNPSGKFSIEALDYRYYKLGAASFPKDDQDKDYLVNGEYDRDIAKNKLSTVWKFEIRNDLKFEDGTPITAQTFEYTLKQFLDPKLNAYRANMYYKTATAKNGYPIKNSFEYYSGKTTWDKVGFEVTGDYTFTVTFFEKVSQSRAVGFGDMILVPQAQFEASKTADKTNSSYGTPKNPFVSYGAYVIKTWSENQSIIFNKNFDYLDKGTVNYKSRKIEYVKDLDQRMQLFDNGTLSSVGLSKQYYAKYANRDNTFRSWDNYPQFILVNLADSKKKTNPHQHNPIMFDKDFRQALFYGFNRQYYATNVYAPNTAALAPMPINAKSYTEDAEPYFGSASQKANLQAIGVNYDTMGYDAAKALSKFNAAYARYSQNSANPKQVKLLLITDTSDFTTSLINYVKESYIKIFGEERFTIEFSRLSVDGLRAETQSSNFDLAFSSIGFNATTDAAFQYAAIGLFGQFIGGAPLGLTQPADASQSNGLYEYANKNVRIELPNGWKYLKSLKKSGELEETPDYVVLYNHLNGEEKGVYNGGLMTFVQTVLFANKQLYAGGPTADFVGATADTWNILEVLEKVFLEYAPLIPTVTRSSVVIYQPNVKIDWPAYSSTFDWGDGRYRYLTTDPDFK